jgi:hypothetical protein
VPLVARVSPNFAPFALQTPSPTAPLLQRALLPAESEPVEADEVPSVSAWSASPQRSRAPDTWPAPGSLSGQSRPPGLGQPAFVARASGPAPRPQPVPEAPSAELLRPIAPVQRLPDAQSMASSVGSLASTLSTTSATIASQATPQTQQQAAEPDIDAIAQKVYEQLRRRLRIDQERLGKY